MDEFLRVPAIRDWLSLHQVQTDFKLLARNHIMGQDEHNQDAFQRLSKTYADKTGENERLASGPIDVILAIIAAGYFGTISPETEPVIGMIQELGRNTDVTLQEMHADVKSIEKEIKDLGPDPYTVEVHNKRAQEELEQLLKRRSLEFDRTLQEIDSLAKRVDEGDLAHADNSIKTEIFYWASRLYASKTETLSLAREYLREIHERNAKKDTRIRAYFQYRVR